jgi:hypothetical protein
MNIKAVCSVVPWRLRGPLDVASPLWNKGGLTGSTDARGAPPARMADLLSRAPHVLEQLQDVLRQRRQAHEPVEQLDACAPAWPRRCGAAARDALGQALSRCARAVPGRAGDGERDPFQV